MRFTKILILVLLLGTVAGCNPPYSSMNESEVALPDVEMEMNQSLRSGNKATGELRAVWQGCEDEHNLGDIEEGDNSPGDCEEEHGDEEHDDGQGCLGARPARNFYLKFDAQIKYNVVKGNVTFQGVGDYEGIDFDGDVTWVKPGREANELFFGGEVTGGAITKKCFLFSLQDNGEGKNAEADKLQYRLFGSESTPCSEPDHLPKGYPISVYDGNFNVH